MADMDIDFSQIKDVRISQGQVKYIVGTGQQLSEGDMSGQLGLWRRPNEFPYVIGAYTKSTGDTTEYFSPYYIEKYEEPVAVKAAYLPTYNGVINTSTHLMATSDLVGTLLNGYYCENEADCQNLHISSARKKLGSYAYTHWHSLDVKKKKILVYASKGQPQMLVHTPYPQHLEGVPTLLRYQYKTPLYLGAGFHVPYGEIETPELCRVLDITNPIIKIEKSNVGVGGSGYYRIYTTSIISFVREDYSDLIEKYDKVTSNAYPKSEYPYLDGVTEIGFRRVRGSENIFNEFNSLSDVFAFYVFFRVAR